MENVGTTHEAALEDGRDSKSRSLSILENYYMMNRCFLSEGQLFSEADKLAHVQVYLVNGRLDMLTPPATAYELLKRLSHGQIEIVEGAGHVDLKGALAAVRGAQMILEHLESKDNR